MTLVAIECLSTMHDQLIIAALNLSHANQAIPYTDCKFHIDKYIMSNWQDEWSNVGANKLHSANPVLRGVSTCATRQRSRPR